MLSALPADVVGRVCGSALGSNQRDTPADTKQNRWTHRGRCMAAAQTLACGKGEPTLLFQPYIPQSNQNPLQGPRVAYRGERLMAKLPYNQDSYSKRWLCVCNDDVGKSISELTLTNLTPSCTLGVETGKGVTEKSWGCLGKTGDSLASACPSVFHFKTCNVCTQCGRPTIATRMHNQTNQVQSVVMAVLLYGCLICRCWGSQQPQPQWARLPHFF